MAQMILIADAEGTPHLVNFDRVDFVRPSADGLVEVTLGEHVFLLRAEMQTLANDVAHLKYCDPRGSRR